MASKVNGAFAAAETSRRPAINAQAAAIRINDYFKGYISLTAARTLLAVHWIQEGLMDERNTSPYIEIRNGGYYVAGSRVSLASVIQAFRQGASPETILQEYPYIGSLSNVYGVIAFILENPTVVEEYLASQEQLWKDLQNEHTPSSDMLARFEAGRKLLNRQTA